MKQFSVILLLTLFTNVNSLAFKVFSVYYPGALLSYNAILAANDTGAAGSTTNIWAFTSKASTAQVYIGQYGVNNFLKITTANQPYVTAGNTYTANTNFGWTYYNSSLPGAVQIRSIFSGFCLNVTGIGGPIAQTPCNSNDRTQQWYLVPAGHASPYVRVTSVSTGLIWNTQTTSQGGLSVANAYANLNVQPYTPNSVATPGQVFSLFPNNNAQTIVFEDVYNTGAVDTSGWSTSAGGQIITYFSNVGDYAYSHTGCLNCQLIPLFDGGFVSSPANQRGYWATMQLPVNIGPNCAFRFSAKHAPTMCYQDPGTPGTQITQQLCSTTVPAQYWRVDPWNSTLASYGGCNDPTAICNTRQTPVMFSSMLTGDSISIASLEYNPMVIAVGYSNCSMTATWFFDNLGRLSNLLNGLCLGIENRNAFFDGSYLKMETCDSYANRPDQYFTYTNNQLILVQSGKCLTYTGRNNIVMVSNCTGSLEQQWTTAINPPTTPTAPSYPRITAATNFSTTFKGTPVVFNWISLQILNTNITDYTFVDTANTRVYYANFGANLLNNFSYVLYCNTAGSVMCQATASGSYSTGLITTQVASSVISAGGIVGVKLSYQGGTYCGASGRQSSIQLNCNPAGIWGNPSMVSITESPTCTYNLVVSAIEGCPFIQTQNLVRDPMASFAVNMTILANAYAPIPFQTPYIYLTTNIINFFDSTYLNYNSPAYTYTLTAVTGSAPLIEIFSLGQWAPLTVGGTFQLTDLQNRNIRISYANMQNSASRFAGLSFSVVNVGSYYPASATAIVQLSAFANITAPAQQYTSARRIATDGSYTIVGQKDIFVWPNLVCQNQINNPFTPPSLISPSGPGLLQLGFNPGNPINSITTGFFNPISAIAASSGVVYVATATVLALNSFSTQQGMTNIGYQIFAYNYLSTSSPMLWNNTNNIMYMHTDVVTSLVVHLPSSILYSGSLDGRIFQWNLNTGDFVAQVNPPQVHMNFYQPIRNLIFDSVSNSIIASVGRKYQSAILMPHGDIEGFTTTTSSTTSFGTFQGTGGTALVYCGGSTSYGGGPACPNGYYALAVVATANTLRVLTMRHYKFVPGTVYALRFFQMPRYSSGVPQTSVASYSVSACGQVVWTSFPTASGTGVWQQVVTSTFVATNQVCTINWNITASTSSSCGILLDYLEVLTITNPVWKSQYLDAGDFETLITTVNAVSQSYVNVASMGQWITQKTVALTFNNLTVATLPTWINSNSAPSGTNVLVMETIGNNLVPASGYFPGNTISLPIHGLTVGATYGIQFFQAQSAASLGNTPNLTVSINGAPIYFTTGPSSQTFVQTNTSFFTASSTQALMSFNVTSNDNVTIVGTLLRSIIIDYITIFLVQEPATPNAIFDYILIPDGDFENIDYVPSTAFAASSMNCGKWTSTNANSVYAVNLIDSSALTTMSGTFGAWIQNYNTVAPSSLSTVLYNLVPGATYNIRYLQGSRGLYFVGQAAFSSLPAAVSSYTLPLFTVTVCNQTFNMPINQMWWFAQYTTPVFTATSTSCVLSFTMFTNIANMDNEMIVDRIELGIMTTPQIQQYTLAGSTSQVPITTTIADGDFELLRNSRNAGATTSTTTLVTVNGFIGSWSYSLTANAGTGSCYLVQHGVNSALYATLSTISPVSGNFQLTMYVRLAGGIYSIVNNIGPLIVGQQYNLSYWHATKSVLNATISVSICGVNYVAPVPTLNAFTQVFFPFVAPSTYCVLNYTSIFGSQQVAQLLSLDLFQLTTIFTVPSLVGTYSVPVQNTYNGLDLTSVAVNAGKLYVGTNPGSTTQYQAPVCTAFQFTVGGSLSNTFTSTCPTSNNAITSIFAANSKLLIGNAVMNEIDVTSGSIIRTIGSTVSAANITTFAMNNNYLLASQDNGITLAWFVPELVSGSFVGAVNGPVCLATTLTTSTTTSVTTSVVTTTISTTTVITTISSTTTNTDTMTISTTTVTSQTSTTTTITPVAVAPTIAPNALSGSWSLKPAWVHFFPILVLALFY